MSNSRKWLNNGRVSVHYRVSIQRFYDDIRNAYYLILVEDEHEEL